MPDEKNYNINLDIKFAGLELIDVPSLVAASQGGMVEPDPLQGERICSQAGGAARGVSLAQA